jgi:hypothetical protein
MADEIRIVLTDEQYREYRAGFMSHKTQSDILRKLISGLLDEAHRQEEENWDGLARHLGFRDLFDAETQGYVLTVSWVERCIVARKKGATDDQLK